MAVGSASRPGDAIIVRHGELSAYQVMVIDGGTTETGETMVTHLRRYYGNDVFVNDMVLTHSDADHASGLRTILENMKVLNLWMHVPWNHAAEARPYFKGDVDSSTVAAQIKREYDIIGDPQHSPADPRALASLYHPEHLRARPKRSESGRHPGPRPNALGRVR